MLGLGGNVIGFSDASNSSTSKGETLADTITVVSGYSDIIAMRHPKDGSAYVATMHSRVPVINAGDGGHNHPTQTLLDLMTIRKELGRLDNFTIGLCGDLTFGRTVHSLATALSIYDNVNFIFISPKELKMPDYIKEMLTKKGISYTEVESLEENIDKLDVLYMTRVQRERFLNEEDYVRLKDVYILDKEKLKTAKKELCILHPLPRVNEISTEVDDDPRACYFKQAEYGRYMRMALILKLLEL
jgi:aspartate carbamoyltransferase catalytic subunit